MAQQKKGLITRLLEGKEKSEEYARSTLPTNRWQLFWDIFKGNFGKIVKVNLLMVLFFLPLIAVIIAGLMVGQSNAIMYPFGANLGIGFPAEPMQQGLAESIKLRSDLMMYFGVVIAAPIAAVGLSGGLYVIRNMIWTEGVFVANDFWKGIKLNYKTALQASLIFSVALMLTQTIANITELALVGGTQGAGDVFLKIFTGISYVIFAFVGIMCLWILAQGVNYKLGFFALLRNSFLFTLGTIIQSVFFVVLAILPYVLFLIGGSLFLVIAVTVVLMFGLAYPLLVWLDFAQWVFDRYINPKIAGAKVGKGIYGREKVAGEENQSSSVEEYKRTILSYVKSRLSSQPMKPIDDELQVYELPESFTREDLKKLRESKKEIQADSEAYVEEHKNDARYVEYNKLFEERERALQDETDKNGKKKKRKPPKLLGQ